MAISINWGTKVVTVPQSFLTFISGSLYELDVNAFRLALKDLEDDAAGVPFLDTHRHNTSIVLSGVTYARTLEIINGYTVTFENGNYSVRCVGANHNIADVKNVNSVSLIVGNSAGLITVTSGSGLSTEEHNWLAAQEAYANNKKALVKVGSTWHFRIYDAAGTGIIRDKELKDKNENDITDIAAGILAMELKSSV